MSAPSGYYSPPSPYSAAYGKAMLPASIGPMRACLPGKSSALASFVNLAAFFTGVIASWQSDAVSAIGTQASGTAPPAIGFITTKPNGVPPIRVQCLSGGALGVWTGRYSLDEGATWNGPFTSAALIQTSNPAISFSIAAGVASTDNLWNASVQFFIDTSGAGNNSIQATASKQPRIVVGAGGVPGALFDGVTQSTVAGLTLPLPASAPYTVLTVMKPIGGTVPTLLGGVSALLLGLASASTIVQQINTAANTGPFTVGSYSGIRADFTGSSFDTLQIGLNASITGLSAGNSTVPNVSIASRGDISNYANEVVMSVIILPLANVAAGIAKYRQAVIAKYLGTVLIPTS